jgi:hypothetical protein
MVKGPRLLLGRFLSYEKLLILVSNILFITKAPMTFTNATKMDDDVGNYTV